MHDRNDIADDLRRAAAELAAALTLASRAGLTVHLDFIERSGADAGPAYAARVEVLTKAGTAEMATHRDDGADLSG